MAPGHLDARSSEFIRGCLAAGAGKPQHFSTGISTSTSVSLSDASDASDSEFSSAIRLGNWPVPLMPASRSSVRRACDACRRRKVKCDTDNPCANCRVARLPCAFTVSQRKRGPRPVQTASPASPALSPPDARNPLPTSASPIHTATSPLPSPSANGIQHLSPTDASTPRRWHRWLANEVPTASLADSACSPSIQEGIYGLHGLVLALRAAVPAPLEVLAVANHCIDLYMQYTFPTAPFVHEPTLRLHAERFFSNDSTSFPVAENEQERVAVLRAFALLTALSASVASVMPDELIPYRQAVVKPFLHASRETLRSFEDHDLERPQAASMTIRLFHSTALQHTTGRSGAAWHLQGQAALIAHNLRLYCEESVSRVADPVESQLLRLHFWHTFASDQIAAAFQARAFVLHESLFHDSLTLQPYPQQTTALMDPTKPEYDESFESRLLTGFHLFRSISCAAARVIMAVRKHEATPESGKRLLAQGYLEYVSLIDQLPAWLQASYLAAADGDDEVIKFRKRSFWVQRCTILTSFHSLKLIILRQCIHKRLRDITGLNDDTHAVAMKCVEMVSEFLFTLEDTPFIYLQVKGEPMVERIRHVGSILLELIHTIENETVKMRAQRQSRRLLDILVVLNSKASDNIAD